MKTNDINFDEDLEMTVCIPEQPDAVRLAISDHLDAAAENLGGAYKEKIIRMIHDSSIWYPKAQEKILSDLSIPGRLMVIYLLSEQGDSDFVFGLLFRVEKDAEHGRGMKISLGSMEILEYGLGDAAFC